MSSSSSAAVFTNEFLPELIQTIEITASSQETSDEEYKPLNNIISAYYTTKMIVTPTAVIESTGRAEEIQATAINSLQRISHITSIYAEQSKLARARVNASIDGNIPFRDTSSSTSPSRQG